MVLRTRNTSARQARIVHRLVLNRQVQLAIKYLQRGKR